MVVIYGKDSLPVYAGGARRLRAARDPVRVRERQKECGGAREDAGLQQRPPRGTGHRRRRRHGNCRFRRDLRRVAGRPGAAPCEPWQRLGRFCEIIHIPRTVRAALMIELDDVTKQFAGKRDVSALRRVTLSIDKGEMVSIIGPSGSGKSTLLNLIGGLDRPTSGEVRVDGQSARRPVRRRPHAGPARQDRVHLPVLQPAADALVPRERRSAAAPARLAADESVHERATELLTLVQLGAPPAAPAGGALRRRASARGDRPRALDLPADPARRRADRQSRYPHRRRDPRADPGSAPRLGSTVVIVTHDMNVARSCSRTITLRDGTDRRRRQAVGVILLRLISWPYFRKHVVRTHADDGGHRARRGGVRRDAHREPERAVRVQSHRRPHRRQDRAAGHGRRDRLRRGGARDGAGDLRRCAGRGPGDRGDRQVAASPVRAACWCSAST